MLWTIAAALPISVAHSQVSVEFARVEGTTQGWFDPPEIKTEFFDDYDKCLDLLGCTAQSSLSEFDSQNGFTGNFSALATGSFSVEQDPPGSTLLAITGSSNSTSSASASGSFSGRASTRGGDDCENEQECQPHYITASGGYGNFDLTFSTEETVYLDFTSSLTATGDADARVRLCSNVSGCLLDDRLDPTTGQTDPQTNLSTILEPGEYSLTMSANASALDSTPTSGDDPTDSTAGYSFVLTVSAAECAVASRGSQTGCICTETRDWRFSGTRNFNDDLSWFPNDVPGAGEGAIFDLTQPSEVLFTSGLQSGCLEHRTGEVTFADGDYVVEVGSVSAPAHLFLRNHTFSPIDFKVIGDMTVQNGGALEASLARLIGNTSSKVTVLAGGRFAGDAVTVSSQLEARGIDAKIESTNGGSYEVIDNGVLTIAEQAVLTVDGLGVDNINGEGGVRIENATATVADLAVGVSGRGDLRTTGSTFTASSLEIGRQETGDGIVTLAGSSTGSIGGAGGLLIVGEAGDGRLNVHDSTLTMTDEGSFLGIIGGAGHGTIELDKGTLSAPDWAFTLGRVDGGRGTVRLLNDSVMTVFDLSVGDARFNALTGSFPNASLDVRDSRLNLRPKGAGVEDWFTDAEYLGIGPRGRMDVTDGGVVDGKLVVIDGDPLLQNRGAGVVSGAGSIWDAVAWIVGDQGRAVLIVEAGATVNASDQFIAGGNADVLVRSQGTLTTKHATVGASGLYLASDEGIEALVTIEGTNARWTADEVDISPPPTDVRLLDPTLDRPGKVVIKDGGLLNTNFIRIHPGGTLAGDGGTIRLLQTQGKVLNLGGKVSPGNSPGTLTIEGDYEQTDGTLLIEVRGTSASQLDLLDVSGLAQFNGGEILFHFIGYTPSQDDNFVFLEAGTTELNGVSFEIDGLEPGLEFRIDTNPDGTVSFTAENDGEIEDLIFEDPFDNSACDGLPPDAPTRGC